MDQLFFVEKGRLEWREIPEPQIGGPEDALVHPLAVATCDLDTGLVHGTVPFPGPFALGHEGVGEVIAVGDAVSSVSVGQRVAIPFQVSCGRCARCSRGLTAHCASVEAGAMYGLEPFGGPWGGFLADVVRVPWADHMLIPLPDGVDPVAVASLSDNIVDGWRTLAPHVQEPAAASVLIVAGGAPSIPFYSVAVAKALGVAQVDYLDFDGANAARTDKAARLGATIIGSREHVEPSGYTHTVCSASDLEALALAMDAVEPDGTCVANAIWFDDAVPVPMFTMYTHGVRLVTGLVNARAAMPKALELVVSGALEPEHVTDTVVDWADAREALVGEPAKFVFRR